MFKTLRNSILERLEKKEDLQPNEQKLLQEEFKLAKRKLFSSKLTVYSFIALQLFVISFIIIKLSAIATTDLPSGDHITVLSLDKPITDDYADTFISAMIQSSKDVNVKAIVIKLRSPGGTPAAAWNIASTLKDLQTNGNIPVYTYIDSSAVSGSYMVASQSDRIYANRFSMVGSIGVIMEHMVFGELSKKVGVGEETLTAGKFKKMISSFSYLSSDDRKYIEDTLLQVVYKDFKKVVSDGRKLKEEDIDAYTEGKVFVASDKGINGILIDQLIDWPDMKKLIIKTHNLDKDIAFKNYELEKPEGLLGMIGSSIDLNLNLNNNLTGVIQ